MQHIGAPVEWNTLYKWNCAHTKISLVGLLFCLCLQTPHCVYSTFPAASAAVLRIPREQLTTVSDLILTQACKRNKGYKTWSIFNSFSVCVCVCVCVNMWAQWKGFLPLLSSRAVSLGSGLQMNLKEHPLWGLSSAPLCFPSLAAVSHLIKAFISSLGSAGWSALTYYPLSSLTPLIMWCCVIVAMYYLCERPALTCKQELKSLSVSFLTPFAG